MLRINQNTSVAGAASYFDTSDYYSEGQELQGIWRGKAAARLGLSGTIAKSDWQSLCDNRHPATGQTLTVRRKAERRVGYDFNFHAKKSISILYGLTGDERIVEAFRDSVNETMAEMEREMKTRVRTGGKNEDRTTGEMVWGEYVHFTSRPVEGVPDMHLHLHAFVHNLTFDEREGRWKAGQFADLKRDAPYFEAKFQARMARRLCELGLPIQCGKKGWEIAGIPESAIKKFSRRTAQIEKVAIALRDKRVKAQMKEEGYEVERTPEGWKITGGESMSVQERTEVLSRIAVLTKQKSLGVDERSELGGRTRQRKQKNLTMEALRQEWGSRLTDEERAAVAATAKRIGGPAIQPNPAAADRAATLAIDHCFERKSVLPERTLLTEALKHGTGETSVEATEAALFKQPILVVEKDGQRLATTRAVLDEEQRFIDFARDGRGTCKPLGSGTHVFKRAFLNRDQRQAVEHVLQSTDAVTLIRGGAGVGKTTMMSEAIEAIEAHGSRVFTFAPSADASRGVLAEAGFKDAETVARLLVDEQLQDRCRRQTIWIDEASLLGTRTMGQVFDLAKRLDARVILSGDRRQHGSVERGAALRLLETEAGLVPAEIKEIQRQKDDYKQAVQALSEGQVRRGFEQLDTLGWIKEVPDVERYVLLAHDYLAALADKKSALVIAPTHREGEWVTDEIRGQLRQQGKLGESQRIFPVLHNANLTHAQRTDPLNYDPGDLLVFHQNAKGYAKGDRLIVGEGALPLRQAERFAVFHPDLLPVAEGDLLRITHNGKTADGLHRLNNGALYTVKGFTKGGDIRLTNGWIIGKDFGHLTHGYCLTSHASQGKTVDRVIAAMSSSSARAASREGFYVTASRGREAVHIYTDSKAALLEAVSQSEDRLSAMELVASAQHRSRDQLRRTTRKRQIDRESSRAAVEREGLSHDR